ncbi:MAG: DMT family transporter [Candidatus Andeanibacterium colombiense]|uniref:DMT family transporter n=1 Tax=Candidatus Andeanibacterium colombiense TaxID=3121345 RepID=A0AAJ5X4J7_9SPHN|nr:MAG: DMT family transporter [Sphingomonadaceae bacterium]
MSEHNERAGLLWVLAGFCTLSIGDAIIKGMAGMWPAPAMGAVRYFVGTVGLAVLLGRREGWAALALPRSPLQWLRGLAISFSALGMFLAVWIMPLAEATTIAFTQPIITALLAMVFLREPARLSTWIATLVAFAGVFIVLRPNFQEVGWGVLFPLMGATGMAVTIIANRKVAGTAGVLAMQYYMSVTAMIFLFAATAAGHFSGVPRFELHWPHWSVVARCAFIGVSATFAQWFIYMGTVKAGAGTVAPMTYGQLLMATTFGYMFFGDTPSPIALVGAAIIVGAGLFLWWDSRRRALRIQPEPV